MRYVYVLCCLISVLCVNAGEKKVSKLRDMSRQLILLQKEHAAMKKQWHDEKLVLNAEQEMFQQRHKELDRQVKTARHTLKAMLEKLNSQLEGEARLIALESHVKTELSNSAEKLKNIVGLLPQEVKPTALKLVTTIQTSTETISRLKAFKQLSQLIHKSEIAVSVSQEVLETSNGEAFRADIVRIGTARSFSRFKQQGLVGVAHVVDGGWKWEFSEDGQLYDFVTALIEKRPGAVGLFDIETRIEGGQ